jgi:transposase
MAQERRVVIGGVDTHKDVHVAAVIDELGNILDTAEFKATAKGYRLLLEWMRGFGELVKVGVEAPAPMGQGWLASSPTSKSVSSKSIGPIVRCASVGENPTLLTPRPRPGRRSTGRPQSLRKPKMALRTLARRHETLSTELAALDSALDDLTARANPGLRGAKGVGADVAGILLVAAGDNPDRLRDEAAFAAMCGANPIEASSGKIVRHRLNRSGNRQANHALWRIAFVRLSSDPTTKAYAARRTAEGKSQREIIRCLKRYIAREIYRLIVEPVAVPAGADLRSTRMSRGLGLAVVAAELGISMNTISQLERALVHNTDLARRYEDWLTNGAAGVVKPAA